MSKLYVGNLSWGTTDDSLRDVFSEYGQVTDIIVMKDRETGRSRGFGFVTFSTEKEASDAAQALNGAEIDGRTLTVNPANARGGGGGGGGGRW
ncbi:heterogeneous nuclear ribonucleoprotein G RNA recognition motif protein [Rhizoctonia solani 123E]|uniref:Heterogeneous nuclear ribonucleoprotein G RNA recognition motif protein n=1 Tax=Rhizoctonia solani 123E TaxID=1423351 RepID=A0A074RQ63_9AGAM|nr:heterogeneous nuclear ribonucleoprotein G RNA recognition motif protein [Rhizoctonia solani 123E]